MTISVRRATRAHAAIALALLLACNGGTDGPAGGGGPAASDESISGKVIEYFQKTVNNPGLTFKVTKIADSEIPGWRRGNLEVALGQQTQNVAFYVTRDGRFLFRSEAVDLNVDPLQQVMSKIALKDQPARGPADAKVVMVEYSDFQCPFCSRVYETLENDILKTYGDKVRFVFKNFPLTSIHPWAEDGALASECAFQQGNDQHWKMYDGLFKEQGTITKENLREKSSKIAEAGGLDVAKFQDCFDNRKAMDAVKADEAEAAALGVNSTPTFFVNGRRLAGAQGVDGFKQLIDQSLAAK
jgi:protein-disulfide isomerase